jgi:hypothetical protein
MGAFKIRIKIRIRSKRPPPKKVGHAKSWFPEAILLEMADGVGRVVGL